MVKNFAFAALIALFGTAAFAEGQQPAADQKDPTSAEASTQGDASGKKVEDEKKDESKK